MTFPNPYLAEFYRLTRYRDRDLVGAIERRLGVDRRARIARRPASRAFPSMGWKWRIDLFIDRDEFTNRYAWAIPHSAALRAIAKYGPVVEIGAGTGYWAAMLRARGVDVVAYDALPPPFPNPWHKGATTWTRIEEGNALSALVHRDRTLFLCWPPHSDSMAIDALRAHGGRRVIYVGEYGGGCTADDDFHAALDTDYHHVETVHLFQWPGVHDNLYVFERDS